MAGDKQHEHEQMGELKALVKSHGSQLEAIHSELKIMNSTLIRNTESLEYHIRRTELNEKALEEVKKIRAAEQAVIDERLKPLEKQHIVQHAYFRLLVFCLGLPAGIYYTMKIVTELLHK